jgi:hypothetical protein
MTPTLKTLLASLENKIGTDFILDLYEDFLQTDAYAYYEGYQAKISDAYNEKSPEWAYTIQGQADMYLDEAARALASNDLKYSEQ